MKNRINLFLLFGILSTAQLLVAQKTKTIALHFVPVYDSTTLELGKKYPSTTEQNWLTFTQFKCYVSHFELYKNRQLVFIDTAEAYLLDSDAPTSLTREIAVPTTIDFDAIRFYFGVDDKTNEKGISGGDLDPGKGMYWTWQTGYINMKLEGNCATVPTADHGFQFHLGGFMEPYASFQPIYLQTQNTTDISISIELNDFIKKIKLAETHAIMSPGEPTVLLSKDAASMFHLK